MTTPSTPPVKEIHLRNIQSLPKATIQPAAPGELTVIVGESDSGKTTLASRALQKLFYNNIPNKELIRRGSKKAGITVVYDTPDNLSISWEWRGQKPEAGKARYVIRRQGMDDIVLEGGGKKVPDAVKEMTGVQPVKIGSTTLNLNFNKQLDGPFLGNISPAERYRVLGALAGTLEVDAAAKEVSTEILRFRRREKEISGEIENLEEEIKQYDYLEGLEQNIKQVEARVKDIRDKQDKMQKLDNILAEMTAKRLVVNDRSSFVAVIEQRAKEITGKLQGLEEKAALHKKLFFILQEYEIRKTDLEESASILEKTKNIKTIQQNLDALEYQVQRYEQLKRSHSQIRTVIDSLSNIQDRLQATKNIEKAMEKLQKAAEANHLCQNIAHKHAEISKARKAIERDNVILDNTQQLGKLKSKLGKLEYLTPRVEKIKELAARIQKGRKYIAGLDTTLDKTKHTGEVREGLEKVVSMLEKRNKLYSLSNSMLNEKEMVKSASRKIERLDAGIQEASREYREILQEAGICEDCPVVDEVISAS